VCAQVAEMMFSNGGRGLIDERAVRVLVGNQDHFDEATRELSPLETQQLMRSHFRQLQLAYQRLEETIAKLG